VASKKTGNPVGRPKGAVNLSTRELRAKAQSMGDDIIEGLLLMFKDKTLAPEARIKAGREILDRGYGKAPQSVKMTASTGGRFDWSRVPDDKLAIVEETLRLAQREDIVIDHD
jgi:hypothetical protein